MKKIISIVFLALFCFTNSTCKKKISKYPFDMYGLWYCHPSVFCEYILEIKKTGDGKIFLANGSACMDFKEKRGKIKFKRDKLFIDNEKFIIFDGPKALESGETVNAPNPDNYTSQNMRRDYKVLARMILEPAGFLSLKEKYQFDKYVNY